MTSTFNPTCSLCGLGFANRPLLELHIREDHAPARTSAPPAGGPDLGPSQLATPLSATEKANTVTGPRRPRRPRTGWAVTALRRVIGGFRHANTELLLASEAIFRPPRAPRPRVPADRPVRQDAHPTATSSRAA